MRVIVGCEFSQIVTKAFRERGHEAYSCDILPAEGGHPEWHFQMNIFECLEVHGPFDLGIFHPPCQYLTTAGVAWWNRPGRAELRAAALAFVLELYHSPISLVAIENPKGHIGTAFRPADQYVQPYDFGQPIVKPIGLWLKGLPLLMPTDPMPRPAPMYHDKNGKPRHFVDAQSSGPNQWKERSRFFPGIARAMATQWGDPERLARMTTQTSFQFA